jgi:hypothetical protein
VKRTIARARLLDRPARNLSGNEGLWFYAFRDRGWLGHAIAAGKWAVMCPWEASHTKGERFDTSTVLFAPGDGDATGWFFCSHAHCAGRGLQDVLSIFTPRELDQARAMAGITVNDGKERMRPADWRAMRALQRRRQVENTARQILQKRTGGVTG